MSNVMILAARGNTGCGDARMAIELELFFKDNGDSVTVVEGFDKRWGRDAAQGELDWIRHKFINAPYVDNVKYDLCVITSVPPKNVDKDEVKAKTIFNNVLDTIKTLKDSGTRIAYLQCDNKISSISRNFYALDEFKDRFFMLLDKIVVHNLHADFVTKFVNRKLTPEVKSNFTISQQVLISTDFDEVNSIIVNANKVKHSCWFIGRSAQWKGWREFRDLHTNYLKDDNWLSVIEGIELSINAKQDLSNIDEFNHYTWRDDALYEEDQIGCTVDHVQEDPDFYRNKSILIYGPYNRVEALNRMHRSKFGMFFTFTGPEFGGQIEITFLEIVGAGTVPIIRKELWDCAYFNDMYLKDLGTPEDLGILVYDSHNPRKLLDEMNNLDCSDELYNKYLSNALSFCKSQFDRKYIIKRIVDKCYAEESDHSEGEVEEISLW